MGALTTGIIIGFLLALLVAGAYAYQADALSDDVIEIHATPDELPGVLAKLHQAGFTGTVTVCTCDEVAS